MLNWHRVNLGSLTNCVIGLGAQFEEGKIVPIAEGFASDVSLPIWEKKFGVPRTVAYDVYLGKYDKFPGIRINGYVYNGSFKQITAGMVGEVLTKIVDKYST